MKITYINHSGFLVETENCYYVLIITKARCRALTKARKLSSFAVTFTKTISIRKSLKFLMIWV